VKEELLDHHIIYGDWDDTHGYQFIVHYHPNGQDAYVFLLAGCDYGGGVSTHFKCSSKELDTIIALHPDAYGYDLYTALEEYERRLRYES